MKNNLLISKASVLAAVLFALIFPFTKSHSAKSSLPQPQLVFAGTEDYEASGKKWTRYKLSVCNRSAYPDAMFTSAPNLPPCGRNTKASRSWVDIYDQDEKRLYGFCALSKSDDLSNLWFAVEKDLPPPESVYIVITDRQDNLKYRSNFALTRMPGNSKDE